MREELNSLKIIQTFEPATQTSISNTAQPTSSPIDCEWVFKTKINHDNTIRYKARLVIKGYQQTEGVDFDETYAPISKMSTLRLLLALSAQRKWKVEHLDVVTAFLNPKIDRDDIYMALPEGIDWLDPEIGTITQIIIRSQSGSTPVVARD
jgi:hypothetical protein